jgi:hypothetical protein
MMIDELDTVILTADIPEARLKAGDVGTVVYVHKGGKGFEVEFMTLDGDTFAVATVDANMVRPVGANEISHARQVA